MAKWYKLDNAAKLFPSVTNTGNSSVFRVSAILDEPVDKVALQKAVEKIYDRYHFLFARLHKGVFWNYLDANSEKFLVLPESDYPCANIDRKKSKGYLIKVLYNKNRISVEVFHSLTDGGGVMEFLKSLIYYYLLFSGKEVFPEGMIRLAEDRILDSAELEDGFLAYYKKQKIKKPSQSRSYRIKGTSFNSFGTNVISGIISASALNTAAKANGATITAYLTAALIYSIYQTRIKYCTYKLPVTVAVPINLRRFFPSQTLRNFFGVLNVSAYVSRDTTFLELLVSVSQQLKERMNIEEMSRAIAQNVKLEKNIFSRLSPLFLKYLFIELGFQFIGENKKTITVSNLGSIPFPKSMEPYVLSTEALLYPTKKSPINCGISSFGDRLTISFTRYIKETDILEYFFSFLKAETGLEIMVYSNDWDR